MRFSSAIAMGLGLIVVLPALSGAQQQQDLEHALSQTVRALAVLSGIEKDLPARPADQAVELARSATEPAIGDERSRDEELQLLRKDVGRLQMTWDELARGTSDGSAAATPTPAPGEPTALPSVTITTGMSETLRAQLSGETLVPFARRNPTSPLQGTPAAPVRDAAADALRQGQALLRANKPKDALIVLRAVESDVRAKYWMARALEKLERYEEALDLYRAVAQAPDAGYLAARATNDADFLEWKRDFAKKLDKGSPADASSPKPAPKTDGVKKDAAPAKPESPAAKPNAPKAAPAAKKDATHGKEGA
ncbi:MAG: hypothetical protein IPJ77_23125 [Planctomycetes bacterium]|nr:hypothetical protein [Planctomycetota bacterium]